MPPIIQRDANRNNFLADRIMQILAVIAAREGRRIQDMAQDQIDRLAINAREELARRLGVGAQTATDMALNAIHNVREAAMNAFTPEATAATTHLSAVERQQRAIASAHEPLSGRDLANFRENVQRAGGSLTNRPTTTQATNQNPRPLMEQPERREQTGIQEPEARLQANSLNSGADETIVEIPRFVPYGIPQWATARLPYQRRFTLTAASGTNVQELYQLRMTSIVDIEPTNSGSQSPQFSGYYTNLYGFYHVIHCKWKMKIQNTATDASLSLSQVTWGYTGQTEAPTTASVDELSYWPGWKQMTITPNTNDSNYVQTIGDTYNYGQFKQEVDNESQIVKWTANNADAAPKENLNVILKNNDNNAVTIRVLLEAEYLVQFKNLLIDYRLPTSYV